MAELQLPAVDFSILGNLPQTYRAAQDDKAKRDLAAARKLALSELGASDGDINYDAGAKRLFGAGDLEGGLSLAKLGKASTENGVFGTPIYGTDPSTGQSVLGVIGKRGEFRRIDTGGVAVTPGIRTVDTGTGTVVLNSRTGQPMQGAPMQPGQATPQGGSAPSFIPKDNQGESRDKRLGQEQGDRLAEIGKAKAGLDSAVSSMERLRTFAERVKKAPGLGGITGVQGMFPNWPGGKAANANALLGTLKSQVAFGVLQAMREASKTGGALGAVSDAEGKRLENNLAALDQAQDMPSFQKAMDDIVAYTNEVIPRLQGAFKQDYEGIRQGGASPAVPQPQATQSQFKDGQRARNAQGQVIEFRGGQWAPAQ